MEVLDCVIVGGGPGGLTAGLYAARARMSVVILERGAPGGLLATTDHVANYPGFPEGITGLELAELMRRQAESFGAEVTYGEATALEPGREYHTVRTEGREYRAKTVILATGTTHRPLGVPGEERLRGKGVSYCATCDGAFFRDREVAVVGGGDSAVQEAMFLTRFARKVTVVHRRDKLRATPIIQERAFETSGLEFRWNAVVTEVLGEEKVEGVRLWDTKTGENAGVLPVDGVFVYIGLLPNTEFARGAVEMDAAGYLVAGPDMATSVPGIYAVGDVRVTSLRQVATAVGDGAMAAVAAYEHLG